MSGGGGGSHFWQCILGLRFLTDHDVAGGTSHTRHCKAEPHAENLYGGPSETPQDMRVRARGSQGWTALGSPTSSRERERERGRLHPKEEEEALVGSGAYRTVGARADACSGTLLTIQTCIPTLAGD